jgi:hypothetical protein
LYARFDSSTIIAAKGRKERHVEIIAQSLCETFAPSRLCGLSFNDACRG